MICPAMDTGKQIAENAAQIIPRPGIFPRNRPGKAIRDGISPHCPIPLPAARLPFARAQKTPPPFGKRGKREVSVFPPFFRQAENGFSIQKLYRIPPLT